MRFKPFWIPTLLGMCLGCAGCKQIQALLNPHSTEEPKKQATPPPKKNEPGDLSMSAQNAQLLQEMIRVTWRRDPPSQAEFVAWVQALDEGASLEGVYNGLVHSAYYRKLEHLDEKPSAALQKKFLQEMIELVRSSGLSLSWHQFDRVPQGGFVELSSDESWDSKSALADQVVSLSKTDFKNPDAQRAFVQFFSGSGFHVMKRVLGQTALRVIDQLIEQNRLVDWYADWATGQSASAVDFGVPQRKNTSREFHLAWVKSRLSPKVGERGRDQIRWEVLNRLHRTLNAEEAL